MELGFIELGKMGSGIAANLVAARHQVTVWNRDRTNAEPFAERGAKVAADLAAAAQAGTVMTMLADDAAVEAVVFGDGGLLAAGSDLLHVSCSSVSVYLTGRLAAAHAAAGQRFVSAQVLGRPDVAAAPRHDGVCIAGERTASLHRGAAVHALAASSNGGFSRELPFVSVQKGIAAGEKPGEPTAWSSPGRSARSRYRTETVGAFVIQ
ncbi:NAD(P)-binding domain-containing protein [Dyella sp. GSA-30]|uniref:NAD(P)-binding domain-containing protein n=1 Tax=Dyella sp. GSA-30 TaxID=2994496 RepID=UPI0024936ADB|nr:NAD(P)-binding domain-containing protein [Dyella sp. GSA-30]